MSIARGHDRKEEEGWSQGIQHVLYVRKLSIYYYNFQRARPLDSHRVRVNGVYVMNISVDHLLSQFLDYSLSTL